MATTTTTQSTNAQTFSQVQTLVQQYQTALATQQRLTQAQKSHPGGYTGLAIEEGLQNLKHQIPQLQMQVEGQLSSILGKGADFNLPSTVQGLNQFLNSAAPSSLSSYLSQTGTTPPKDLTLSQALNMGAQQLPDTVAAPNTPAQTTATHTTNPSTTPQPQLFNLQAALQPYVQPYENMMDKLLGSTPGKAPTVAQAESAGLSQLAPYLQGLPQGLQSTITSAAKPEFAALAGLPTAVNASVQTTPYAGLLQDLVSAAKNQMIYGAGIGTPTPPGALGAVFQDVTNAGTGLSGLTGATGLAPAQTSAVAQTPSVPGG